MDEEGGAAVDGGAEEADAGFGGLPVFDDDVVELVAEEVVGDGFVLAGYVEEVGEGADGGDAGA
jgi:hypothetical protein